MTTAPVMKGLIMKIDVGINMSPIFFYLIFCAQVSKDLLNNSIQLDDRIWMLLCVMQVFLQFFIRLMSVLYWLGFFAIILFVTALFFTVSLLILNYETGHFTI